MSAPTFSQAKRPNLLIPIAIAFAALASIAALIVHFIPRQPADLTITHTATWQTHTLFKSDSIIVGRDKTQDDLYVLTTLHIDNRLHIPIFPKDFTATLITATGETLESSAVEKSDLAPLYETFPALRALATPPLVRESTIPPGQSADGMILLHFPATIDTWNSRKSATLTTAFYHQSPQIIPLPAH